MFKHVVSISLFLIFASPAYAIDAKSYCRAIYKIEGGANTHHPYGILAKYKHTTPKQACINTVNHAFRDWNGQGSFNRFLANRYAPVNSDTDNGTNQYWLSNLEAVMK